jgi:hypothetical protein
VVGIWLGKENGMIDTIAMSVAARAVGYRVVADMIERQRLSPEGVARLFKLSARYDRNRAAAGERER